MDAPLPDKKLPTSISACGIAVALGRFTRAEASTARQAARAHLSALFGEDKRRAALPDDVAGFIAGLRAAATRAVIALTAAAPVQQPEQQRRSSQGAGLCWMPRRGQWRARVWQGGREVLLGHYADERAAQLAVEAAAPEPAVPDGEAAPPPAGSKLAPFWDAAKREVRWHQGRWMVKLRKGRLAYFDSWKEAVERAAQALAEIEKEMPREGAAGRRERRAPAAAAAAALAAAAAGGEGLEGRL